MTYEEAKEKLKKYAEDNCFYSCGIKKGESDNCYFCADAEMFMMAIKAIKKQIPKKPVIREDGWLYWHCPLCGREVGNNMVYKDHHCRCGQAIDWSEEE